MSVDSLLNSYGKNGSTVYQREQEEKAAAGQGGVSKTDFLKLLTTQLTNQDPLNPTQDVDFTAQLAQLQALDEQMAMTKTMTALRADTQMQAGTAMIGKYVSGKDATGANASGLVSRVVQSSEGVFCELANKQKVPVTNIENVWNDANSMTNDISSSGQFIGMFVSAGKDAAGNAIEGIVEKVGIVDGIVVLSLYGGQSVTWDKVQELRIPTEDEQFLYQFDDYTRQKIVAARNMVGSAVTGMDAKGNEVTGVVSGAAIEEGKIMLTLYTGEKIELDNVIGDAREPTIEELDAALTGYYTAGLDSAGKSVEGVVTQVLRDGDENIYMILDDGSELYLDYAEGFVAATDEMKSRLHGQIATGTDTDGNEVTGYIVKKVMHDGRLAVQLSTGEIIPCKNVTNVRAPATDEEKAASKQALEDAKNA